MVAVLVPPVTLNATVLPPVVRAFPNASLACRVSVAIAPDNTLVAVAVTTDVALDTAPARAVTVKLVAGSASTRASKPCTPATVPSVATVPAQPLLSDTTSQAATPPTPGKPPTAR